jgi:NADH-quinone oxidoreductase subunit F
MPATRSLETIHRRLRSLADGNRCFLPVEEQQLIGSLLRAFPEDFDAHLSGACPSSRHIVVPKLVELDAAGARYDTRQMRKRPDWTYADGI